MNAIWAALAAIFKALFSALLDKPIGRKETYHDAKGDPADDAVFDDSDW